MMQMMRFNFVGVMLVVLGVAVGFPLAAAQDACPSTMTNSSNGQGLTWQQTPTGHIGNSSQVCLSDGWPLATRPCFGNASWGEVEENNNYCQPPPSSNVTEDLRALLETDINEDNAIEAAEKLQMLTQETDILLYVDVIYASRVMEELASLKNVGTQVGDNIVRTASNLLKVNRTELAEAQMNDRASTRIVQSLEEYAQTADLEGQSMLQIVEQDIALQIWDLPTTNGSVIGFGDEGDIQEQPKLTTYTTIADIDYGQVNGAIIMSDEVLESLHVLPNFGEEANNTPVVRLTFALYQEPEFFLSPEHLDSSNVIADNVNSEIISFTVGEVGREVSISNLTDPILLAFQPKKNVTGDAVCSYWDFDAQGGYGDWSTEGCSFRDMKDGKVVCECNHLTTFAILTG